MKGHFLNCELRRLQRVATEFATRELYVEYLNETLGSLKKFNVVHDYHLTITEESVSISLEVPVECYETLNIVVKT